MITPGQWGDSPQARGLIEGLPGVGHVFMDAAYDADHLRLFIAQELGAMRTAVRNMWTPPETLAFGPSG